MALSNEAKPSGSDDLSLEVVEIDDPRARELEQKLIAETKGRYGERGQAPLDGSVFDAPTGCFLLGTIGDEVVACGGFRYLRNEVAEIKRMYVEPSYRGEGIGYRILRELEARALMGGYRMVWLETGSEQPEAIKLYTSSGYESIEPYGEFKLDPRSRCFARSLNS